MDPTNNVETVEVGEMFEGEFELNRTGWNGGGGGGGGGGV